MLRVGGHPPDPERGEGRGEREGGVGDQEEREHTEDSTVVVVVIIMLIVQMLILQIMLKLITIIDVAAGAQQPVFSSRCRGLQSEIQTLQLI